MAELLTTGVLTPQIMGKTMQKNLDQNSVWHGLTNKRYEGEVKTKGDTVDIIQYGNVTVKPYEIGTPMEYQKPDANKQKLEIDAQDYFAFEIDDITKVQAQPELIEGYFARSKVALNLSEDTYLFTKAKAGIDSNNIITVSGMPTKEDIYGLFVKYMNALTWSNALQKNGMGLDGKRPWAVVDPDIKGVILESNATKDTTEGDRATRSGALFEFCGFDIIVSTNSDRASKTKNIIVGTTDAITFANQINKTQALRDKDSFGAYCSGLHVYGAKVVEGKALAGSTFTVA